MGLGERQRQSVLDGNSEAVRAALAQGPTLTGLEGIDLENENEEDDRLVALRPSDSEDEGVVSSSSSSNDVSISAHRCWAPSPCDKFLSPSLAQVSRPFCSLVVLLCCCCCCA